MITFFNKLGNSWIAKIIFLTLAISMMAVWGLGGFVNTDLSSNTALKVGKVKIPVQQVMQDFSKQREQISRQGKYLSHKKALEQGLLQAVLEKEIQDTLQAQVLDDMGLTATEQAVARYIELNPAFMDDQGHFDARYLQIYLNSSGLTERELLKQLQQELAWKHLKDSVTGVTYADKQMTDLVYKFQNDKFDIEYMLINPDAIVINQTPTQQELQDYYEAYADEFTVPERRTLEVVELSPATLGKEVIITPEELDELYAERKGDYGTPEKREVAQIRFSSLEDAQKKKGELTAKNFEEKALSYGQEASVTKFGWIQADQVLPEIAEAVFATPQGTMTDIITTDAGWQIFLVKSVKKAQEPDEKKAKEELKTALIKERVYPFVQERVRQVEDALGAGKNFEEVVQEFHLTPKKYENILPAALENEELPNALKNQEIVSMLFTLKEGEVSPILEGQDSAYVVQVEKIDPLHKQDFSSVQNQLKEKWLSEKKKGQAERLGAEALQETKTKGVLSGPFKKQTLQGVSRAEPKGLNADVLRKILAQKSDLSDIALIQTDEGNILGIVKAKYPVKPDPEAGDYQEVVSALKQANAENFMTQLMDSYGKEMGISVNEKVLDRAFSVYTSGAEDE